MVRLSGTFRCTAFEWTIRTPCVFDNLSGVTLSASMFYLTLLPGIETRIGVKYNKSQ